MPKKKSSNKKSPGTQSPDLPFQNVSQLAFLGWDKPILHSAIDYLIERYAQGNAWDMDRVLVVLPGSMASRRLQVLIAQRAAKDRLVLRPPRFLTLGKLPEELYQAKLPFASELTQVMAWVKVLRSTPSAELQPLLFEVPALEQLGVWMDLAKLLGSLHRELASDLLDFKDVAEKLAGTVEEPRWQILAHLQRRYLDVLHEAGLWDIQSARRFALEHGEVDEVQHEVVLLGTVDLNRAQRQFLAAIGPKVQVLVGAPESFAEGYDRDGTLRSSFWQNLEIPIDQAQIHVRTSAVQAAQELAVQLAKLGTSRSVRDITIGVPDPSLVPALQESLAQYKVALRYGPGIPIYGTPPMKVLYAIEEYLRDPNVENFSNLIRIPWIETWLRTHAKPPAPDQTKPVPQELPADFLSCIDEYLKQTLLRSVSVPQWPQASGREVFVAVVQALDLWLQPLRTSKRPLDAWAQPLREIYISLSELEQVDRTEPEGHIILRGCREINSVLDRLANVPPNLNLEIELSEALAWLQQQLQGVQIPPLADDAAIEMLGWLDVALDDAPVLMMTGLHDGVVPESVNSDAFLPNRLRSELGLLDNARRYARDAYVMMACLHTREQIEFIMNRFSSNSDPLTPSRLMMAVATDELPDRVAKLISEQEESIGLDSGWPSRPLQSDIQIPKPDATKRLGAMAVTDFKKYSECPYRFYLRKLCRTHAVEHLPQELDGGGFGDMVHSVLEGLKDSPVGDSTDPKSIGDWLSAELDAWVKNRFGLVLPPALVVQIEQARLRLTEFSKHQADWAKEGWRIKHIEHNVDRANGIIWNLDHGQMIVHGRIDRIDVNEKTQEVAVWDYKTGDNTEDPRRNHLKADRWVDWQLPLYGLLIETLGYKDLSQVRFGYILLPKNVAETKFISADFTPQEHRSAIESAKALADRVLQGEFWPPAEDIAMEWDDYRFITQRTVVRPWDPSLEKETPPQPQTEPSDSEQSGQADEKAKQITQQSKAPERPARGPIVPKMIQVEPVYAQGVALEEWFQPSMILASAGTGKTYQLASRAIRLLFTDQPLDSILATTFTRKAAGEILHRILEWLSEASRTDEGLHRLQTVIAPMQVEQAHARYQLSRLCSHLHRFRVSTLDSFYSQLAKSFALELKLPPGWTLLDTAQEDLLVRDAITQLFDHIDHQQLRTLVSQLSKGMAVRGVRVEVENLITDAYELFRQAPEEAWAKIQVPKGPDEEQVRQATKTIETIELKSSRHRDAKDKALATFRSQQWDEFLGMSIVSACLESQPTYYKTEIDPQLVAALRILLAKAKTEFFTIRRIQNEASHQLLKQYHRAVEKLKQTRRVVTFSDIADRLADWMRSLLAEHQKSGQEGPLPQMQSISHRMDSSIDHLLLDEFQDTSPNQWLILKPFAEAIVSQKAKSSKRTSFFVVGDTKQAIYAWRGGVSEILESVGEQVQNIKQQKLSESYRSSPIIMDFVNRVFHGLAKHPNYLSDDPNKRSEDMHHPVVSAWVERYFIDHSTARTSLPGVVEFWNAKDRPQEDQDTQEPTSSKKSINTDIDLDIAESIAELHRRSDQITIGVLTRTNADVARMISLLRDRGVEASQEGGNPLIDTAPVLVIQSALKLAEHSGDTLAYFHTIHSPLKSFWNEETCADATKISLDLRDRLGTLGFGGTVSALVNYIAPHCSQRDQERLLQLVDEAYRFDSAKQSLVHEFVDRIATTRVATQAESVVRVMTIHQSKGLEFDAVFIPAIDQAIIRQAPRLVAMRDSRTGPPISIMRNVSKELQPYLPLEWQVACQEASYQQLGEALCLFYVALTRARHALYLFATPNKNPIKQWGSALHSIFANDQTGAEPGLMIYRNGQVDWIERIAIPQDKTNQTHVEALSDAKADRAGALKVQLRLEDTLLRNPQWIAPSQQPKEETLEPLVDYWKSDDTAATVIGKLIHRWFEEIRTWIEDFHPDKNQLLSIAASALTKDEMMQLQLDQQADRFLRYCRSPVIREVFSKHRYTHWHEPAGLNLDVTNERRFLVSIDDQLIRGIMDRCVLGWDGDRVLRAEVIDFKTDARPGNIDLATWVALRVEHHVSQLQLYRKVLCRQFSLHPEMVQVTLVLLSEEQIVSIA